MADSTKKEQQQDTSTTQQQQKRPQETSPAAEPYLNTFAQKVATAVSGPLAKETTS